MLKLKELSVEDLQRDLGRLQGLRTEAETRIRGLKEGIDLTEARDAELARAGFAGKHVAPERSRLREQTAAKQAELDREVGDLGILVEELGRVDQEITATKRQGDVDQVAASAERRKAGLLTVAREVPVALAGVIARVEELTAEHQAERQVRQRISGTFDCPGEKILERLRYLVGELLAGVRAIEEGKP